LRLPHFEPERARRVFLAGLGLVYVGAFASLLVQIVGLVGEHGILPIADFLARTRDFAEKTGMLEQAHRALPTLCWLDPSDGMLRLQCVGGIVAGALVFLGVAPLLLLPIAWVLYLSLSIAGQEFLQFQWDILLLETGFFAIWIAPGGILPWGPPRFLLLRPRAPTDPIPPPPSIVAKWAVWLLLFRFMFASGYVKLSWRDETWRDLTALTFHYWTQPLPSPLGWFANQAPLWFQKASCFGMFVVELGAPWLLFCGRIGRNVFGIVTLLLMVGIAATGNYGFFEPLTIVLALSVLSRERPVTSWAAPEKKETLERERPRLGAVLGGSGTIGLREPGLSRGLVERREPPRTAPSSGSSSAATLGAITGAGSGATRVGIATILWRSVASVVAGAAAFLALIQFGHQLVEPRIVLREDSKVPAWLRKAGDLVLDQVEWACVTPDPDRPGEPRFARVFEWIGPYRTLNTYGLFRSMTTRREEVIVEGSDDGKNWLPYEFRYKPGDPKAAPCWCEPHMPRLDWQMWFLPLGARAGERWFDRFLQCLLRNEPTVLALLAKNPFPDAPPKLVRAQLYDYRFSTPETRAATGEWWFRTPGGLFARPVSAR
jgi:hypothetical protein